MATIYDTHPNYSSKDLVEVVRCKDCKHWTKSYGGFCKLSGLDCFGGSPFGPDGYCSRGEKIDD